MAKQPERDCPLCPRLTALRTELRHRQPEWHNAPVPPLGPPEAPVLIVGLAPGVAGANRTGRAFTGDYAGTILYPALIAHGLARGRFEADPGDGLALTRCRILNAVRCVPPQNRPIGAEVATCRTFLQDEIEAHPNLRVVLTLGRIAHDSALRALGLKPKAHPFKHGAVSRPAQRPVIVSSYHTSRYNVNTGVLTPAMFDAVVATVAGELGKGGS